MHKICAGLRGVYAYTGNSLALAVLVRLCDWACDATMPMSESELQRMLDREHGGMSEILAEIAVLTSDRKDLELAQRFVHHALLGSLAAGIDPRDGLHSNTQIPKIIGLSKQHRLTAREEAMTVKINGRAQPVHRKPSSYLDLELEWKNGDVIELIMPIHLRTDSLSGVPEIVAILYGPLVPAGRYGTAGITAGSDIIVNERTIGEMLNVPMLLPA